MLKIGVLGAGHLGKIHIRLIQELKSEFELVGFFDPNPVTAAEVAAAFGITPFSSAIALIDAVDCLDIVSPTPAHFEAASAAIKQSKHVFIEKPVTHTTEEALVLLKLAREAGVVVQIGHVERFNPAFQQAQAYIQNPMFIETHRLAVFNPRGTDVPVVLDLMIHDIDIVLSVVKSGVKRISASGVSVVSETQDIANARIEFDNGAVANLTASRISLKNMRKSRFFQKDAYISVDFLSKELEVVQLEEIASEPDPFDLVLELGEGKPNKKIQIDKPTIENTNAIQAELKEFHQSIRNNTTPTVSIEDGYRALEVANLIMEKLKVNQAVSANNN